MSIGKARLRAIPGGKDSDRQPGGGFAALSADLHAAIVNV